MLSYSSSELIAAANPNVSLTSPSCVISVPFLENSKVKLLLKHLKSRSPLRDQRFYLQFEKLQGNGSFPIVDVYIQSPNAQELQEENYAGALGLYGLQESSTPSLEQDGSGMNVTLDVTNVFQKLRAEKKIFSESLELTFVLSREIEPDEELTVGRVEVFFRKVEFR